MMSSKMTPPSTSITCSMLFSEPDGETAQATYRPSGEGTNQSMA